MKKHSKNTLAQYIRSYIYVAVTSVYTVLYSFICLATFPLPLRYRCATVRFWSRSMIEILKWICHVNYHVEGLENIPKDRVGIIFSKHQSTWETYYLQCLTEQAAIITKRELLWIPFFGWAFSLLNPIAINRKDKSSAMAQIIAQGKKCIAAGRWILVFPEGTRIPYGQVGKYRLGGARLAVETHSPILPVAHNAGLYWKRKAILKKPGTIQVVIGPLIETTGRTPEEVNQLAQDWIESTIAKMPGEK
jgi:1-acyl-sn-glycerol-3-phosphate acyltransferase